MRKRRPRLQSRAIRFAGISLTASIPLVACVAIATVWGASAQAQVVRLDARDYGKVALHHRQSLGGAVKGVQMSRTIFEPIAALRPDDPLAMASRAVVRIDLLVDEDGRQALVVCTGTLISPVYILTNSHCVTPSGRKLLKASAVFDHTSATGQGAKRVQLATTPVEDDAELDYAILRLQAVAPDGVKPLRLSAKRVVERQRLRVVHHPLGRPKMMTQFRCQVAQAQDTSQAVTVRHVCDTQKGSSGAVLLHPSALVGLAVHHSGGLSAGDPESFNVATSIIAIARRSAIVARLLKGAAALLDSRDRSKPPDETPQATSDAARDPSSPLPSPASSAETSARSDVDQLNEMLNPK